MSLKQHVFGNSHHSVSVMGLGLAALGRPGYINLGHAQDLKGEYAPDAMQAHAQRILDAAWAAGVRYFDVARSYGRGEAFLGSWLAQRDDINPTDVTIGSKWGYTYTADWQVQAQVHEVKEHSLAVLTRQWAETQAHLGDYLALYQIHSATFQSGVLKNTPVLTELARLKANGVLIGLSVSGTAQAEVIHEALLIHLDGVRLFDSVQATWNLLDVSAGEALREAHQRGLGVIIKEALANGRLTARNTDSAFADQFALLQAQADRLHTSVDALALAAVLQSPWVHVVLSGAATVEHLTSNLGAADVTWDEEAATVLADLVEPPDLYWSIRDGLAWT